MCAAVALAVAVTIKYAKDNEYGGETNNTVTTKEEEEAMINPMYRMYNDAILN